MGIQVWTTRKHEALYCMEFSLMNALKEARLTLRSVPSPLQGTSARMRSKRRGSSCRGGSHGGVFAGWVDEMYTPLPSRLLPHNTLPLH